MNFWNYFDTLNCIKLKCYEFQEGPYVYSQVSEANTILALSLPKAVNLVSLFPETVQWPKLLRPFLGNNFR